MAYVIDSGLWRSHEEFAGRVAGGAFWDFGDGTGTWDCDGHGTHVTGTLGGSTDYSPARVPAAVTVAASTDSDERAPYSNYGSCNDIFAPGSNTLSAYVGSDTATAVLSGTSMAGPHVAGAAALLLEADAAATPAAIAAELDARSTKGVLTSVATDPNKLLYVGADLSTDVALTVAKGGSGAGTVVSSPAGIDCGSACTASVPASTIVDLVVDPASGSTFTGWSGGGCSGTSSCAVTMDVPKTVTATFTLVSHQLTVSTAGPGSGTVSSPSLPSCSTTCSTMHSQDSLVTLTATPNPGSTFTGWSAGDCSGTSSCAVTMDASKMVTATFTESPFEAVVPARLLDSRAGGSTVDGGFADIGVRVAGSVTELTVTGRGGVPADAEAVVLNVTVTQVDGRGYVTVFPCGSARPNASNLNHAAGQTVANAVVAKVGPDGTVCLYTSHTVHLIVDVNGAL